MANGKVRTAEAEERYRKRKRAQHQRYYGQTANIYPKRFWTKEEEQMVMEHSISDREISDKIGRSMKPIQEKRRRMRREAEAASLADSD